VLAFECLNTKLGKEITIISLVVSDLQYLSKIAKVISMPSYYCFTVLK
jgi:hypothetical protein